MGWEKTLQASACMASSFRSSSILTLRTISRLDRILYFRHRGMMSFFRVAGMGWRVSPVPTVPMKRRSGLGCAGWMQRSVRG